MDPAAFVARVRAHYVEQFAAFAEAQRRAHPKGAAEVKIKLEGQSNLYDARYCVDFIGADADGKPHLVEMDLQRVLTFDPFVGEFLRTRVEISHLRWDDVVFRHGLDALPPEDLHDWFLRWFDPEETRYVPEAHYNEIVHSVLVLPGVISVDFGTAPAEAFWQLMAMMESAGADHIAVTSSKAEAATAKEA